MGWGYGWSPLQEDTDIRVVRHLEILNRWQPCITDTTCAHHNHLKHYTYRHKNQTVSLHHYCAQQVIQTSLSATLRARWKTKQLLSAM